MTELSTYDVNRVLAALPKAVVTMLQARPVFLGGGFIRAAIAGETPSDIDLFGPDKQTLTDAANALVIDYSARKPHHTRNALTVLAPPRMPVQFIHRGLYSEPEKILTSFDFTVAQAVLWWDEASRSWQSLCAESYYADLAARRLVYTYPVREEESGGSLMRVLKFLHRGYHIDANNLAGPMARVFGRINFGHSMTSDEQGTARVITALLRQVDPLTVVDGMELVEEDNPSVDDVADALLPAKTPC